MVIGVDHAHTSLLIVSIEDLQHILADKLIIPIQVDHNGILTTIIPHSIINILQCGLAFTIVKIDISIGADIVKKEIVTDKFVAAVVRGIVDDDCKVVCVVLGEDGV